MNVLKVERRRAAVNGRKRIVASMIDKPHTAEYLGHGGAIMPEKITALNPMGYPPKVERKALAPRLDALDGKTVYLVDCRFDDSELLLKEIQNWFRDRMPSVKTVLTRISSVYTKDSPETWEEIKAKGNAAIIGVGH
jgi:hypothetical protein